MTLSDWARANNLSMARAYQLIAQGRIPGAVLVGRSYEVPEGAEYVRKRGGRHSSVPVTVITTTEEI